jgi:hypothetical protein
MEDGGFFAQAIVYLAAADIEGTTHYRGRANRDANSNYYIEGLDGFMWSDGFMWNDSLGETMSINTWVRQQ